MLAETIIVCWIYGADKFCKNLQEMYGKPPAPYWRICWKYVSPTILLFIFLAACMQELSKYHSLTYGTYIYPSWAPIAGLLMTGSSVCLIPIYAVYYIRTKTTGSLVQVSLNRNKDDFSLKTIVIGSLQVIGLLINLFLIRLYSV